MDSRNQYIKGFRGDAIGIINAQSSSEEFFQNQTLRPILKLQNDLFIEVCKNYIVKSKTDFQQLSTDKKLKFIENSIQKDIKFRNSLKGIVIGLYTIDEYLLYTQNSSALNKRMMSMLIERLKSQVQLFDSLV
jgi:hypothetical protein